MNIPLLNVNKKERAQNRHAGNATAISLRAILELRDMISIIITFSGFIPNNITKDVPIMNPKIAENSGYQLFSNISLSSKPLVLI